MANLLTLKGPLKVHFVDKGAAVGAKVLVVKREKELQMSMEEKIAKAVAAAVSEVMKAEGPLAGKSPAELLEEALKPLGDEQRAAVMAAITALHQSPAPAPVELPAAPVEVKQEEVDPEAEPEKQEGDEEPEVKKEEEQEMEKNEKNVDEIQKRNEDLEKRLSDAEDQIAKAKADSALAEQVEVAKGFKFVPGDVNKRAALLLGIKKNQGEDAYKEIIETLKSADELAKKGLEPAPGTSRNSDTDGDRDDEPMKQLEKMASERVAKSDGKEDYHHAFEAVCKENRELYKKAAAAQSVAL